MAEVITATGTQNQNQQPTAAQNQQPQNPTPTQANAPEQNPNPTPGTNEPNGGEVTIESLTAQMAEMRAANASLKSNYDKLCASEGNLRKQLRAKQTAEEQEAEAKAEQEQTQKAYVTGLEKRLSTIEATNRYLDMGMDKELAEKTAAAEIDGNRELVNANIKKYQADWKQQTEASLKSQLLKDMPFPQSGNQSQVDYSQQIQTALSAGDSQAAALAILQQASANTSTT